MPGSTLDFAGTLPTAMLGDRSERSPLSPRYPLDCQRYPTMAAHGPAPRAGLRIPYSISLQGGG